MPEDGRRPIRRKPVSGPALYDSGDRGAGRFLYSTALLTTSTILPQMQGAMPATQDEIAWAMTFNILATAVVTPMTGWLVSRFGTKRVGVCSIACFTLATLLC